MRSIFLFTALSITAVAAGQSQVKLPDVLPPTPDVSAMIRNGNLSANPHTGAANASIPIYTIKLKDFSFPISLNYSTNGFKPDEIPSRTGTGWSLSANGVVTRVVRGKPDDGSTTPTPPTVSDFANFSSNIPAYMENISNPGTNADAQPDEYRFNVNGLSGKFFVLRDGSVMVLPYNGTKISIIKGVDSVQTVIIKDTRGVVYTFSGSGAAIETTITHNMSTGNLNKSRIRTSWFLTKIEIPSGDYINFNYSPITIQNITGITTTVKQDLYNSQMCGTLMCPVGLSYASKTGLATYQSWYLTGISATNGVYVTFNYEDRPYDNSGDNRLTSIYVHKSLVPRALKKMTLTYDTVMSSRYFLKEVAVVNPENESDQQKYSLEYINKEYVSERLAGITDHAGFANDNGTPSSYDYDQDVSTDEYFAAEINKRRPNATSAQKGILKKITYPTGGSDEFTYEANLLSYWDTIPKKAMVKTHLQGVGGSPSTIYNSGTFTPTRTQKAEFYVSTWYGTAPAPGGESIIAFVRLYVDSSNALVHQWTIRGYTGYEGFSGNVPNTIQVQGGVAYRMELEVRNGSLNSAIADLVYDVGTEIELKEFKQELCGVRVKKITSFDPVANKSNSKYYFYRSLTDTFGVLSASAQKMYFLNYFSTLKTVQACFESTNVISTYNNCEARVFSVNTANVTEINDAAGVVYTYVIEADDEFMRNGGIEHKYMHEGSLAAFYVLNGPTPDGILDPYTYLNGLEVQTRYFNGQRQLVKKVKNVYRRDTRLPSGSMQLLNYIVIKHYDWTPSSPYTAESFPNFDVAQYSIYTAWDHLDTTITTDYIPASGLSLSDTVIYRYSPAVTGTPLHTNVTDVQTTGSDGKVAVVVKKFPPDFPSVTALAAMTQKNMLSNVVEEESFKNNVSLSKTVTDFVDASTINAALPSSTFYVPSVLKRKTGTGDLENRIRFLDYDAKINIKTVAKENDVRISYIWDYAGELPVAEVANATYADGIAYTSFEALGRGGWTAPGEINASQAMTGFNSYILTDSTSVSKSGLPQAMPFTVTYWAKNGTVSVNGSTGNAMMTKNGWTLYKHDLVTVEEGGVQVTGSALIDELRLHPQKAMMKTLCYLPEIGAVTTADVNNQVMRYEYDGFNRLVRIRDIENNILKQVEYKYGDSLPPCDTAANWVATGNIRCVKNHPVNNANTGEQVREERDMNNCSPTYLEYRWVSNGTSSACPVQQCTGQHKRFVNGNCITGLKTLVKSVYVGNMQWVCFFEYTWADGYKEQVMESGAQPCIGEEEI